MTFFLLSITILSLIPGQLLRMPFFNVPQGLILTDFLVFFTLMIWSMQKILTNRLTIIKSLINLPLFLTLLWFLISLIWGALWLNLDFNAIIFSSFFLLRFAGYAGIFFIVKEQSQKRKKNLIKLVLASILILSVLGIMQIIFFPNLTSLSQYGWDPHQNRLVSTWLDPNFLGAIIVIGICLLLYFFYQEKTRKKNIFYYCAFLLLFTSVFLTFSRSAYLMLLISLLIFSLMQYLQQQKAVQKRNIALLFILPLVFILVILIIPQSRQRIIGAKNIDQTASFRIESWKNTYAIAKKNLITGTGFNTFRFAQEKYGKIKEVSHSSTGSDSSFLLVFATTGILGFCLYLWLYWTMIKITWKKWKIGRVLGLAVLSILIGLLAHSQFVNSLFYPHIILVIWILLGVI